MKKAWFHIHHPDTPYSGDEAPYADPAAFRWTKEFEENTEVIFSELKEYLKAHDLDGYFITSMVSRKNSWKTISTTSWGIQQYRNQKYFPKTTALVRKYPELVSASFNLLEAKSNIHPHCGDTNTIYRCHLGLEIPGGLPECGMKVKGQDRAWQNGKWLVFVDAYDHEAYNQTDRNRFIFVVDVIRDEFREKKGYICATVRTSLFLQRRWQRSAFLKNLSAGTIGRVAKLGTPFMRIAIGMVNFFKVY
jgi:aspartyl/asparaginyl beta-hydroxylase (cupin superfamily)